jgi:hypothetical protein
MTTDVLIQTLANDVSPVKRLDDVRVRFLRWVFLSGLCVTLGTIALGCRSDLSTRIHDLSFVTENAAVLLFFGFSAMSAMQLSVPGLEKPRYTRFLPFLALSLWILLIGFRYVENMHVIHSASTKSGLRCVWRILLLGSAPAVILFVMVRKAAPLKTVWAGWFVSTAAFSLATFATQIICPNDKPLHIFKWHILPLFVLSSIGAMVGNFIYKRKLKIPGEQKSGK